MSTNYTEHLGLTLWEPDDPVLRTEFNANNQKLDQYISALPRIAVGSYVGTGTSTAVEPNTLTFDFCPMFVAVSADNAGTLRPSNFFIRGQSASSGLSHYSSSSETANLVVNWTDNSLSWYCTMPGAAEGRQLNQSGKTYCYFAIGV